MERCWLVLVLVAAHTVYALKVQGVDHAVHSGMNFRDTMKSAQDDDALLDSPAASGVDVMRAAGLPDSDVHAENGQMMGSFAEDNLDAGGRGEQMQLSGGAIGKTPSDEKAEIEEDDESRVSSDMSPLAAAANAALNNKEIELATVRQQLDSNKNAVEQQTRDAKRLIQEAYSKQAYLRDLQTQVTQQSLATEEQKHRLTEREASLQKLQDELEKKLADVDRQSQSLSSQATMHSAIQTQMQQLDAKMLEVDKEKKDLDTSKAHEMSDLEKMKASIEKMKQQLDERSQDLEKKETDLKKLFVDLNAMKKNSEKHETFIREQEEQLKQHQAELKAKEEELNVKETHLREKELARTHKLAQMAEPQTAIQVGLTVKKDISELPAVGVEAVVGVADDTAIKDQIAQQPPVPYAKPQPQVIVPKELGPNITIVDRTTRSVETRLDVRPDTYGQKLLVGQSYASQFQPKGELDFSDTDGHCRNSRGDLVPCDQYSLGAALAKNGQLPPVQSPLSDVLGEIYSEETGPCVLKCTYHRGSVQAAGPKNTEDLAIEIPVASVVNNTYACPRTNNGYPLLHCSLLFDGSDKCRSTCVFDGSANPLKPQSLGIGLPASGPNRFMATTDYKSMAQTTYQVYTNNGCKSAMKADPLVACEVRL